MKTMVLAAFLLLLCGCVSQSTMLVNEKGETAQCKQWGFGLIGAPVALIEHDECLKKARADGYSESPKKQ